MVLDFNRWIRVSFRSRSHSDHLSPTVPLEEIREDLTAPPEPNRLSYHNISSVINITDPSSHNANMNYSSWETSSPSHGTPTPTAGNTEPWMTRGDLTAIQQTNGKDVRCVSWVFRNITDPEALDAAIRFAGTVRWFEDGIDIEIPYDTIVSVFHTCFDFAGNVYPGLSDRAYHSARAILWIHIRAIYISKEFSRGFSLPYTRDMKSHHSDLTFLLGMFDTVRSPRFSAYTNVFTEFNTPAHIQWASHALLCFCWAKQRDPNTFSVLPLSRISTVPWNAIPLDATLDLLLVWSVFLGCPIEEEVLKIKDKT